MGFSFKHPSSLHLYSLLPFFPFFLPTLAQYPSSSQPIFEVLNNKKKKSHHPFPPPRPVNPAGASVMLLLGMCHCGTAEPFPREGVAWRSACSQVGNCCTWALGPLTFSATHCKACKRRQGPQNAVFFLNGSVREDPGAALDRKEKYVFYLLQPGEMSPRPSRWPDPSESELLDLIFIVFGMQEWKLPVWVVRNSWEHHSSSGSTDSANPDLRISGCLCYDVSVT